MRDRLEEIRWRENRCRMMTPEQMIRFYKGGQAQPPRPKGRFVADLGQAMRSVSRWFRINQPGCSDKVQG